MALGLSVALGSAFGGILRYWCSGWMARLFGETFPWGTLLVNVLGSMLIGVRGVVSDGSLLGTRGRRDDQPLNEVAGWM